MFTLSIQSDDKMYKTYKANRTRNHRITQGKKRKEYIKKSKSLLLK